MCGVPVNDVYCRYNQELSNLVELSRLTHRLLIRHLPLDSFELLFNEANVNVTSPYGRIAIATMFELQSQILPHYCFNGSTTRLVGNLSSCEVLS